MHGVLLMQLECYRVRLMQNGADCNAYPEILKATINSST